MTDRSGGVRVQPILITTSARSGLPRTTRSTCAITQRGGMSAARLRSEAESGALGIGWSTGRSSARSVASTSLGVTSPRGNPCNRKTSSRSPAHQRLTAPSMYASSSPIALSIKHAYSSRVLGNVSDSLCNDQRSATASASMSAGSTLPMVPSPPPQTEVRQLVTLPPVIQWHQPSSVKHFAQRNHHEQNTKSRPSGRLFLFLVDHSFPPNYCSTGRDGGRSLLVNVHDEGAQIEGRNLRR